MGTDARLHLTKAVAAVLAETRRAADMSQEALAFECGLHPTYISKLERGVKMPTVYTLVLIAQALDRKPHELMRHIEERM